MGMKVMDIYVRVSQADKYRRADEGYDSPRTQEDAGRAWAEREGISVGQAEVDENVSGGRSAAKRKLEKLIQRVESGDSHGIIVYDLKRWSREDPYRATAMVGRVREAGGRVKGIMDNFDSDAPGSAILAAVLAEQGHAQYLRHKEDFRNPPHPTG